MPAGDAVDAVILTPSEVRGKDQVNGTSDPRASLACVGRSFPLTSLGVRMTVAVLLVTACTGRPAAPAPLHLTTTPAGPDTRVTLIPAAGLKVNARLAPALELADGTVLRIDAARRTADSAYFAEPATALLPGHRAAVHGTLRASVCRDDEQVCRTVTLEL
jgi:hypothetical protein